MNKIANQAAKTFIFLSTNIFAINALTTSSNRSLMNDNYTINNGKNDVKKSPFDFTNEIAEKYVWTTVPIFFLVIGTVANILSIIVFTRREMLKYSSFCYFAILNVINLILLYVSLGRTIFDFNFQFDIRTLNLFTCKMHVFLIYFLGHLSSLLLSTISIDRVISVIFLHKAKVLCTPRVAYIVTSILVIFNFLMSSHFLYCESGRYGKVNLTINSTIIIQKDVVICSTRDNTSYRYFITKVWKIIDMSFFAFIPFIIMTLCSIIIIIRVAQQSKKFQKNKKASQAPTKSVDVTNESTNTNKKVTYMKVPQNMSLLLEPSVSCCETTMTQNSNGNNNKTSITAQSIHGGHHREAKFSSRTRNLALMLIPVNILFLIFLAPVVITIYFYEKLGEDKLTLAIVESLANCNYTFNFFIYFLTSSKFREEFYKYFNNDSSNRSSNNRSSSNCLLSYIPCLRNSNNFNTNSNNPSSRKTSAPLTKQQQQQQQYTRTPTVTQK